MTCFFRTQYSISVCMGRGRNGLQWLQLGRLRFSFHFITPGPSTVRIPDIVQKIIAKRKAVPGQNEWPEEVKQVLRRFSHYEARYPESVELGWAEVRGLSSSFYSPCRNCLKRHPTFALAKRAA